jgi:hypothetical protein
MLEMSVAYLADMRHRFGDYRNRHLYSQGDEMVGREVVFIRKSDVQVFEDRFPRVSVRYFTREHLNICIRVRWFGNRIMNVDF